MLVLFLVNDINDFHFWLSNGLEALDVSILRSFSVSNFTQSYYWHLYRYDFITLSVISSFFVSNKKILSPLQSSTPPLKFRGLLQLLLSENILFRFFLRNQKFIKVYDLNHRTSVISSPTLCKEWGSF